MLTDVVELIDHVVFLLVSLMLRAVYSYVDVTVSGKVCRRFDASWNVASLDVFVQVRTRW